MLFFLLASPHGQPTFILPNMPLKQGLAANITCLSSPSKPASKLVLYANEQIVPEESPSLSISYELDVATKKNLTKLVYLINDPDGNWHNARLRCEQIYQYENSSRRDVFTRIQVYCKSRNLCHPIS